MTSAALILSYNDSNRAIGVAESLLAFSVFDEIVIVDNNSPNSDEIAILKNYHHNNKIKIIFNPENRGYGAGNNVGLRYLYKKNCKYVYLINPDISVKKESVVEMLSFLSSHKKCALVTTLLEENNKVVRNFYDPMTFSKSFISSIISSSIPLSKINGTVSNEQARYLARRCKTVKFYNDYFIVKSVRESGCMYNMETFHKIGFFDEGIFMYDEQFVISFLLDKYGYFEAVLFKVPPYQHNHRSKHLFNRKSFAELKRSRIYFFKKYLKYGWFKIFLIKLIWINVYLK